MSARNLDESLREGEEELAMVRREIAGVSAHLRDLRAQEARLEAAVEDTRHKRQIALNVDVTQTVRTLETELQRREREMAEMQARFERMAQEKDEVVSQLAKVKRMSNPDVAGAPTKTLLAPSSRYENTPAAVTGSSHDPLNQSGVLPPQPRVSRNLSYVRTTDDLGLHETASPFVHKEDYVVKGERPQTASQGQGGRFSDWRKPGSRGRVVQPPGGHTHNIFG
eukprot:m.49565 g.49565  ORF g.49565 m.49565 type:complete len:224 (+) comp12087_c2_seq1:382-1053(+)